MTRKVLFNLADGSHRAGAAVQAEFSAEGGDTVTVRTIPEVPCRPCHLRAFS